MEHEETHPEFLRLVAHENLLQGNFIKGVAGLKDTNRTVLDRLSRILDRGKAQGKFRKDVEALDVHVVISGFCVFRLANRYTFEALHGIDLGRDSAREYVRTLICDTVLKFLAP